MDLQTAFSLSTDSMAPSQNETEVESRREDQANRVFDSVLKSELFGDVQSSTSPTSHRSPSRSTDSSFSNVPTPKNLFSYQSPTKPDSSTMEVRSDLYSVSPFRQDSQRLLLSPKKKEREIAKVPYRVLDAPQLTDDFYLNLLDWGPQDILAVGLGSCVYVWNAATGKVSQLCDLHQDQICSIAWIGAGTHLAVGTQSGLVEIWDASTEKCTRTMTGHESRTCSLTWNHHVLTSGARDHNIIHRDVRSPSHYLKKLTNVHTQEVCGLKWNLEENKLVSGGNDNKVVVWEGLNERPLFQFNEHLGAVKALSWSCHQRGILASGGGTADKRLKIWNTLTGQKIQDIETGSQICNLMWSKNSNEIVSTHGYPRNQISVWGYPSMQQVASLTGHTSRVLYLAMSPDGRTIVTGAGDETLRFWSVFDKSKSDLDKPSVLLDSFMRLR